MRKFLEKPIHAIWISVFLIVIRILIDVCYEYIINPYFEYSGFLNEKSNTTCIVSWCIFVCSLIFISCLSKEAGKPSTIVVLFLYFFSFLPFTTCVKYGLFEWKYIVWATVFWYCLFMLAIMNSYIKINSFPKLTIDGIACERFMVTFIAVVSCFITLYISFRYTGLRIHWNLLTVYDLRSEAANYNMSRTVNYLFAWSRAINPFMMAYCFIRKKKIYTVIFAFCALLNFGFDGSKTALFFPVLFICVAFLYMKIAKANILKMLIIMFLCVGIMSLLEYIFNNSIYICSYMIRRVMMVENLNSSFYYDFFQKNTPDYFRGSFLRILGLHSPYSGLSKIIGEQYWRTEPSANCGLIADAITNFGVGGVIGYPILFTIIMRIYDKVAYNVDTALLVCTGLYISIRLVNTFMLTSLLTHGIVVLFVLLYCVSKEDSDQNKMFCKEFSI